MADWQGAGGLSSTSSGSEDRREPDGRLRLVAILLIVGSAMVTAIGICAFIAKFLLPMLLPDLVVRILGATVLLLLPGAALSAAAAWLARWSRARCVFGCAAGILALCLLSIAAAAYLYSDFSSRQGLAAWLSKPGYRLTFSWQSPGQPDGSHDARSLETARLVVARRLDPFARGGVQVATMPPDRVVVTLDRRFFPQQQKLVEDLARFIGRRGLLEFRVLPTTDRAELSAAEIKRYTEALTEKGPGSASDNQYRWVEIRDIDEWHNPDSVVGQSGNKHYVLASNRPDETMLHEPDTGGWKLENAYPTTDDMGRSAIGFTLDQRGGDLFWSLTKDNGGRPLAILLDNVAIAAPTINPGVPIRGQGIIMGMFTTSEVADMVTVLNSDPLPFDLHLTESVWED